VEFGQFSCGKQRNFASRPAEFGKIFHGKLWAIIITITTPLKTDQNRVMHFQLKTKDAPKMTFNFQLQPNQKSIFSSTVILDVDKFNHIT